ncbi:hypothetical protein [Mucilaginibacter phyllosphaerae]|uniref:Uncharacterized protein n=1 Tax=Mucilaginibacter phyllosphaerae TaxID=1812349 RepID=A0ABR6IBG6_9SPHI|nr:hypothetical protein [Mucilaginibacter phyllosphaerae]MBB3970101.1 hypothetical protein [Mucilaginibacter phyllosphaerae]
MKTFKTATANKLASRFDQELMNILMNDLRLIKLKTATATKR